MSELSINTHISGQFNAELEDVRQQVLAMGALVECQIAGAMEALTGGDQGLAEEIIVRDAKVNHLEVAIDEACNHILVRRQPTASDLRLVVTVIKTITDIERIGDEAEKIARMAVRLVTQKPDVDAHIDISFLGEHVRGMVCEALDAFVTLNPTSALSVAKSDRYVDCQYEAMTRQCITFMMADPRVIQNMLNILWAVRALERIGDHACNICEYVIYLAGGRDVRHMDIKNMEQEITTRLIRKE